MLTSPDDTRRMTTSSTTDLKNMSTTFETMLDGHAHIGKSAFIGVVERFDGVPRFGDTASQHYTQLLLSSGAKVNVDAIYENVIVELTK